MAKDFAMHFYNSKAWRNCRKAYMSKAGGLCEICLAKGIIKPGEIVHHKVHLTPDNINNPAITLSFDNLQLVCRECHAEIHESETHLVNRRYTVDECGNVKAKK